MTLILALHHLVRLVLVGKIYIFFIWEESFSLDHSRVICLNKHGAVSLQTSFMAFYKLENGKSKA